MVSVKLTKRSLAWRAEFLEAATAYLLAAGARPSPHANDFALATCAGPLSVSVYGNWLACRFADPALANALLAPPGLVGRGSRRLNPWSLKWNFHFAESTPVADCLAEFAAELGPLLGGAAGPAGAPDGGRGRGPTEPAEECPAKAHAGPLDRLLLDRDHNALVRGNERREDEVRAMAADDHAQEFLDAWGWAAYALALGMLEEGIDGGPKDPVRIDGRDVRLFRGGVNVEAFHLDVAWKNATRPRRFACRDLPHAAAVVALMLDSAARKVGARRLRSDAARRAAEGFVNPFRVGQRVTGRGAGLGRGEVVRVTAKSVVVRAGDGSERVCRCGNVRRTASGEWACDLNNYLTD